MAVSVEPFYGAAARSMEFPMHVLQPQLTRLNPILSR